MRRTRLRAGITTFVFLILVFGGIGQYGQESASKTSQAVGVSDQRTHLGSARTNAGTQRVERKSRQYKTQARFSIRNEPGIESGTGRSGEGIRQVRKAVYPDPVSRGSDWIGTVDSSPVRPQVFIISAYTAGKESTGKGPGDPGYRITTSGKEVQEGRTVSADWSVLPAGTVIEIEGLPGIYVVEDTGGAIKGNRLDLYFEKLPDAIKWGRQKRVVRVVK